MLVFIKKLLHHGVNYKRDINDPDTADSDHSLRDGVYQSFVSVSVFSLFVHSGLILSLATILQPQLNITNYQEALIASLPIVGMLPTGFFMGPLSDKIGRKSTCSVAALITAITWAMIFALPQHFDLYLLFIIRPIAGISAALAHASLVYVSEVANKRWRSSLLTMTSFFKASGYPLAAVVGSIVPWRSYALFCLIVSLFNIILIMFVPESPHWLFRSDSEGAKQALMKLNKNQRNFNEEWKVLEARRLTQDASTVQKTQLLAREVRRPMSLLVVLFTLQQFGGIYLIIAYPIQIFNSVIESTSETLSSTSKLVNGTISNAIPIEFHETEVTTLGTVCFIGVGVIRMVMAGMTVILTKYVNNRTILIFSAAGGAVFAFAFVVVFAGWFGPVGEAIPIFLILSFQLFLSYGVQVTPWTLMGELIPLSYRAKGSGMVMAYSNFLTFFTFLIFPYAVDWFGLTGLFVFFGVVAALTCFFVYIFIPETRGKTFSEIEEFFR